MYGPCSACGDGDTAQKYHSHDRSRLRPPYTVSEIEQLTQAYVTEVAEPDSMVDWRMSDFILWLRRQLAKREQGEVREDAK